MNLAELQQQVRDGKTLDYHLFYGHYSPGTGVTSACFSQWYNKAPFRVDGILYQTCEHYMMWRKAKLFDDGIAAAMIRACPYPDVAKQLGRDVTGFDEATWQEHRSQIVVTGNLAKFTQHEALRDFLLQTGDAILVEASPRDRIWGIGLDATHPNAHNPLKWRGLNLLGFALMSVRETLKALDDF